MSDTVGDGVAGFLERAGIRHAFGVISIHNMPMLDAIARRGRIRFVPARSEGGAVNMADAHARVGGGIGVAFSSTGTAAGNACGALVEAATAGTPLLHLTGQIDTPHLDRGKGFLHEARDQIGMLAAAGKAACRVAAPERLEDQLREAVRVALTPPRGPVSVEIPIDVQSARLGTTVGGTLSLASGVDTDMAAVDALAERLAGCGRVMLWLGGGARQADAAVKRLADIGFGIVTSVQGRGVFPENDHRSLGAFNLQPPVEAFYETCDAMVVVGSRLRSNETLSYSLRLPRPLFQVDADPLAAGRAYPVDRFVRGDALRALDALADRLESVYEPDGTFHRDLQSARGMAEEGLRATLGPYNDVLDAVLDTVPDDLVWVRDITLSNTTWGNRLPPLCDPRQGVHALGGGIGQGLPMAVGAALAADGSGKKTVLLAGDGGFAVTLGELATARQENADIAVLLMNDGGYGVIRNIQDAHYDGRKVYADILAPDFGRVCDALDVPHHRVGNADALSGAMRAALAAAGPAVVEVDMTAMGDFARPFAGPPARQQQERGR